MPQVIVPEEIVSYVNGLPEVLEAKARIDLQASGSVNFSIPLTQNLRQTLLDLFGLALHGDSIPMRWIKGDTPSHIDSGRSSFDTTYLLYLTDSPGELLLDGISYPIQKGYGYFFSEGLSHETIGTGTMPRLLLGPMSEQGFPVGGGISAPGGSTVYIRQNGSNIQYSIDNKVSWSNFGDYPVFVYNTNTSLGYLTVEFATNITIDDTYGAGLYKYFACASDYIQFGSKFLNSDGSRPVITINTANYEGFIQNGTMSSTAYNNVVIYNLIVSADGLSTTGIGGWVARPYYGNNAFDNYIVNCSSTGDMPGGDGAGGIVGAYAATGGSLIVIGCSSSGSIGSLAGGIAGGYAGQSGGVLQCDKCWSTGAIDNGAGGILGTNAGQSGTAYATKCYSTGAIGFNAGGIVGRYAGLTSNNVILDNCYSNGNIAADGGGLVGLLAYVVTVSNSYSLGNITTAGTGIFGSAKTVDANQSNSYAANGAWSTISATSQLTGVPTGSNPVGTSWVASTLNQPYEINGMGYTPYSLEIINSSSALIQTFSESVQAGQSSSAALNADASGNAFRILASTGDATITMSLQTGRISTTAATALGTYTITLRSIGSYNITTFSLTVTAASTSTDPNRATSIRYPDSEFYTEIQQGRVLVAERTANPQMRFYSYEQYARYKASQVTWS